MKKKVLVLTSTDNFSWWSMQEIIPAIEKVWEKIGEHKDYEVTVTDVSGVKVPGQFFDVVARYAKTCDYIVATASTPSVMKAVYQLRVVRNFEGPVFFYVHGDATSGFLGLADVKKRLIQKDAFIVSCEADAEAVRCSYKNPNIIVLPFPLCDEMKVEPVKYGSANTNHMPLLYVGRISEQKNLHTLFLSLWILNKYFDAPKITLDIYGKEDGYGSPNMNYESPNYTLFLKGLASHLGIEDSIRWHGLVDRAELNNKIVKDNRFIFVSPTLHSDENFGASALASLLQGSQAVITRWGGHTGFEEHFPNQLSLVPVHGGVHGPFLNPFELSQHLLDAHNRAIECKDRLKARRAAKQLFSTDQNAKTLIKEIEKIKGSDAPLVETDLLHHICKRRKNDGFQRSQIFHGYADFYCKPYFRAYGEQDLAEDAIQKWIEGPVLIAPWVQLYRNEIRVADPHRGIFRYPTSPNGPHAVALSTPILDKVELPSECALQLLGNGFAFPEQAIEKQFPISKVTYSKSATEEKFVEYLGLGKVQWGTSVCRVNSANGRPDPELFLTERATHVKADPTWPSEGIEYFLNRVPDLKKTHISENRDAQDPFVFEQMLDKKYPFFDWIQKNGFKPFTRKFNSNLKYLSHHYCHAMAAVAVSPFERSLIVVMDGAGTEATGFEENHFEDSFLPKQGARNDKFEEVSVYLQEGPNLKCVLKRWQTFQTGEARKNYRGWTLSEGLGIFYEESAKYIFNSHREAGKVMGLSPFGKPNVVKNRLGFLKDLDWDNSFQGKGKTQWETSGRFKQFANYAATVQHHFESDLFGILKQLNKDFPDIRNLIFTGGCALNCIANMKIIYNGLFDQVYVPPFPSDECIAFGAAHADYLSRHPNEWQPVDWSLQKGNFGPKSSIPDDAQMIQMFKGIEVHRPDDICSYTAEHLKRGKVIAWFQGRSESGPRALGNRSILARIDSPGMKDYLNARIKGREAFRPYGSTFTLESAKEYLDIPSGFESPFMSFAAKVRTKYKPLLKEVTHVNGTSRFQTVSRTQNPRFWALLNSMGRMTGLPAVLNTSLNIMGQPIVEKVLDARMFLETTPVDGLVINDLYISKRRLKSRRSK